MEIIPYLDTSVVSNLDVLDQVSTSHDNTGTFVATHQR